MLVRESILDILKPKSKEEIINSFKDFEPNKLLDKSIGVGFIDGIKNALERGASRALVPNWGNVSPNNSFRNFLVKNKDKLLTKKPSNDFINKILKKSCQLKLLPLLKWAISVGGNVNHKDNFGSTPLYYASRNQAFDIVKFLVEHGADVNAKNRDGMTATLALVALSFDENILWYLIDKGANIYAKNNNGSDILNLTIGNKNRIGNKLMDMMGNKYSDSHLVNVIRYGSLKNLKHIIETGNFHLNRKLYWKDGKSFPINVINFWDAGAFGKMNYLIKMGAKITPNLLNDIKRIRPHGFNKFLNKHSLVSESLKDVFKPKKGSLEKLEEWRFKNLMQSTPIPKSEEEWLKLHKNLARELNYQGIKDSEEGNIVGFDFETELGGFPGSFDLFLKIAAPEINVECTKQPEFGGGLILYIGHLDDGSKVIYYKGGLIDGYIARKEWLI